MGRRRFQVAAPHSPALHRVLAAPTQRNCRRAAPIRAVAGPCRRCRPPPSPPPSCCRWASAAAAPTASLARPSPNLTRRPPGRQVRPGAQQRLPSLCQPLRLPAGRCVAAQGSTAIRVCIRRRWLTVHLLACTAPTAHVLRLIPTIAAISHPYLPAVEDVGLPVNGIMGTSAGALIGSMYAAGYSPREVGAADFVILLLRRWRLMWWPMWDAGPQRTAAL